MKNKGHYKWDEDISKNMQKKALDKLEVEAQLIISVAKAETPVKWNPLRESAKTIRDDKEKCIWLSFGDKSPSNKYAIFVHERMDLYHKVGKAKYLADPFNRMKDKAIKNVIDELKKGG